MKLIPFVSLSVSLSCDQTQVRRYVAAQFVHTAGGAAADVRRVLVAAHVQCALRDYDGAHFAADPVLAPPGTGKPLPIGESE